MRDFDSKGLELAKTQGKIFAESISEFNGSSSFFIKTYMNSQICKLADVTGVLDTVAAITALHINNPTLDTRGNIKYSKEEMYWIGYLYRYWAYTYKWSSKKIYKIIQSDELKNLFNPYHSLDPGVAIKRIMEAKKVNNNQNDLVLLKRIYGY